MKKVNLNNKIFISSVFCATLLVTSISCSSYAITLNTGEERFTSGYNNSIADVQKEFDSSITPRSINVMYKEKVLIPMPEVEPVKSTDKFVKVKKPVGGDGIKVKFFSKGKKVEVDVVLNVNWVIVENEALKIVKEEGDKLLVPIPQNVDLTQGDEIVVINKIVNNESTPLRINVEKEKLKEPVVDDIIEGDSVIKIKKPINGDEIIIQFSDKSTIGILRGVDGWKDNMDRLVLTKDDYLLVGVQSEKIMPNSTVIVKVIDNGSQDYALVEKKVSPKNSIAPDLLKPNAPTINQPYSGDRSITIKLPKNESPDAKKNIKVGDKLLVSVINSGNSVEKLTYEIKENDIERGFVVIKVIELKKDFDIIATIENIEGGKSEQFTIKVKNKMNGSGGSSSDKENTSKLLRYSRISDIDRIGTSVKVSKRFYKKADSVIIARADIYPDSLTAGVLAKELNAPILLISPRYLDKRVEDEIARLGAKDVIIVGGIESVALNTEKYLNKFDEKIERLSGRDRYETSSIVADKITKLSGKKQTAIIASGETYADALSIGPYAAENGYPILLVKKDMLPSEISKSFKDLDIDLVYVIGGENTIEDKVIKQLPKVAERIFGKDRYETSTLIAKSKFSQSSSTFISSGDAFSDSLVIGSLGGRSHMPVLLIKESESKNVKEYIKKSMMDEIVVIGGKNSISDEILMELVGK